MTDVQVRHARDLFARPENTVTAIAKLLGVSRNTIYGRALQIGLLPVAVALWVRRVLPEAQEWQEQVAGAAHPNPFRPLFAGRRLAPVNTVLVVVATGALFAAFRGAGKNTVTSRKRR
ncbi:hypothetical protein ACFYWN_23240 [Streptomyces sp. NPDC002917]|uniref:hypothetical protein n=1 Tax=unclassified Streptomyces TaxID=2593676 RepID=UPI00367D713B